MKAGRDSQKLRARSIFVVGSVTVIPDIFHSKLNDFYSSIAAALVRCHSLKPMVSVAIELSRNLVPASRVVDRAVHDQASKIDGASKLGEPGIVQCLGAFAVAHMLEADLPQQSAILGFNAGTKGEHCMRVLESKGVCAVEDGQRLRIKLTIEAEDTGSERWRLDLLGWFGEVTVATATQEGLEGIGVSEDGNVPVLSEFPNDGNLVFRCENVFVDLILQLRRQGCEWEDLLLK